MAKGGISAQSQRKELLGSSTTYSYSFARNRKYNNESIEMPTILVILGWRFFFYSNEGNEPIHVHCQKGDAEAKYWLDINTFDISQAHAYNMSAKDKRTVRRIIFNHFDHIVEEWNNFQDLKNG